ncbi:MAG TPA: pitrilysin family protein [Acidimicrobiales bacterium]|nr:pitrilysin family protein [Acidimicrobiales bacterium]
MQLPIGAKSIPRLGLAVERFTLDNGLRVVLNPDRSVPTVGLALTYDVGFRSEPEGSTGFAHLFEHFMFQGSENLEKGQYDKLVMGNGGILNGSTHPDFTNYIVQIPSSALELQLWLEADRMRGLVLTAESLQNQIDVVKEEIRLNVMNRPFGGFPWIYMPPVIFKTFNNAHNGYGSFDDLEAATPEDTQAFFDKYYVASNAVLSLAGDFDVADVRNLIERHFGDLPKRPAPPLPDCSEPRPDKERRAVHHDPLAPMPALAISYRVPDPVKNFREYCAAVMLVEILTEGDASRLHKRLVKQDRTCAFIQGGIGGFDAWEMRDPTTLDLMAFHPGGTVEQVQNAIDEEIDKLSAGVESAELNRARTALVSSYVRQIDSPLERAIPLGNFEMQRGRGELINEIPELLAEVQPADVVAVAEEWLRPDSRGVLEWVNGPEPTSKPKTAKSKSVASKSKSAKSGAKSPRKAK